ncbi:MAG: beta strand repeat-containing protein, partial [Roseimicrobium sp.]
ETTETIGAVALEKGSSLIQISLPNGQTSGTYALRLSNIIRDIHSGAVINFQVGGGTLAGTTNTPTAGANPQMFISKINNFGFDQTELVNGIIGGWAVVNGSEFATYRDTLGIGVKGNTGAGFVGYESGDTNGATALHNVNDGSARTLTGAHSIWSYRNGATSGTQGITLGNTTTTGTLVIGSGGLLTNATVGTNFNADNVNSTLSSGNTDLFVWVNQNTLTLSTPITGTAGLVKSGTGTLVLDPRASVDSTVTGPETITASTTAGSNVAIVSSTSNLYVGQAVTGPNITVGTTIAAIVDGTTIQLSANASGSGFKVDHSFGTTTVVRVPSTTGMFIGMPLSNNSGTNIGAGAVITSIIDAKHILVSVPNASSASSTVNFGVGNDYTGTTVVNGGVLTLSGAAGLIVIPGDLVVNGGSTTATATSVGTSQAGQIASTSNVTINGGGTITMTGSNTLKSLTLTSYGGTVQPTFTNSGTLTLTSGNAITAVNDNFGTTPIINAGNLTFNTVLPFINVSGLSPNGLIITSIITQTAGMGAVTKTGSGALTLNGVNTFSSGFNLNQGTVIIGVNTTVFGSGTLTIANGTTITPGITAAVSNPVSVGANASFTIGGSGANTLTFQTGAMTLGSGAHTITVESPLTVATFSGVIAGPTSTGLVKAGDGIMVLGNAANTYGGSTTVTGGVLRLLNAGDHIPNASALTIGPRGVFDLAGITETIGSLAGDTTTTGGIVTNSSATAATLTLGDANNTTFAGVITQGAAGAITLTKVGTGTLTLTGLSSYTGATAIQAGAISVNTLGNLSTLSSLGAPTTLALGTIALGASGTNGTLIYTGATTTTNRVLNLAGTTGGGTVDASGSGPITFSSALTATGAGIKTLTLTGNNTGNNTLSGAVVNNSASNVTGVTKTGPGTWVLAGVNTYTGPTIVSGGTLVLSRVGTSTGTPGVDVSAITVNGGGTLSVVNVAGNYFAGRTGTAGGSLTLNAGGSLTMGDGATANFNVQQPVGSTGLTITGGSILLDLNNLGGTDKIVINGIADIQAAAEVDFNPISTTTNLTPGTYDFITAASFTGGSVALSLASNGLIVNNNGYTLSLTSTATARRVVVAPATINEWYWKGNLSGIWDPTINNWAPNSDGTGTAGSPDVVDKAIFAATDATTPMNVTLGANVQVGGLIFKGTAPTATNAVTIAGGGNTLRINALGIDVQNGSANHTISAPVRIVANQTWNVTGASQVLTVSGIVSDPSGKALTKAGAGTLVLSGNNTFTGAMKISDGTLQVNNLGTGISGSTPSNIGQSPGQSSLDAANLVLGAS